MNICAAEKLRCRNCVVEIALQKYVAEIALQRIFVAEDLHCRNCVAEIALQRICVALILFRWII